MGTVDDVTFEAGSGPFENFLAASAESLDTLDGVATVLGSLAHNRTIDDYGDPWTYDYQTLIDAPLGTQNPSAHSISALTGRDMKVEYRETSQGGLARCC